MLARLESANVTAALRAVLHDHPLAGLGPSEAQAEYVVKNDVITALARRKYADLAADTGFALEHERLPAAAVAAGKLQLISLAATLASMLDDDVMAAAAADALLMLVRAGADALLATLQARLERPQDDVRNRLALIRVLLTLGFMQRTPPLTWLARALRQAHPSVRAAAAWVAWKITPRPSLLRALLHGVLTPMYQLSAVCREVFDAAEFPILAVVTCLRRGWELDVYDVRIPIDVHTCAWIIEHTLTAAEDTRATIRILEEQAGDALQQVLAQGAIRNFGTLKSLLKYGDMHLRAAAIAALRFCEDSEALNLVISAYTDPDRRVRTGVRRTLASWPYPSVALRRLMHELPQHFSLLGPISYLALRALWQR